MINNDDEPKDLGIKVGSKNEVRWTQARDKLIEENERAKMEIEINTEVINLCEKRIKEEQERFK